MSLGTAEGEGKMTRERNEGVFRQVNKSPNKKLKGKRLIASVHSKRTNLEL